MDISIEAVLTHDEIMKIVTEHVKRESGREVKSYRLVVSQGKGFGGGGLASPTTIKLVFDLKDNKPS